MDVYTIEQQFNRRGKPENVKVIKETRCDFSGKVVSGGDRTDDYPAYYCKLKFDYEDQDPCFGSGGKEYKFGQDNKINMYEFLSQPYVIFNDEGDTGETEMPGFLKALVEYATLEHALRDMRINTAKKLIADGTITASMLYE